MSFLFFASHKGLIIWIIEGADIKQKTRLFRWQIVNKEVQLFHVACSSPLQYMELITHLTSWEICYFIRKHKRTEWISTKMCNLLFLYIFIVVMLWSNKSFDQLKLTDIMELKLHLACHCNMVSLFLLFSIFCFSCQRCIKWSTLAVLCMLKIFCSSRIYHRTAAGIECNAAGI